MLHPHSDDCTPRRAPYPRPGPSRRSLGALLFAATLLTSCGEPADNAAPAVAADSNDAATLDPQEDLCRYVDSGFGPDGTEPIGAEVVASGLEVPWGIAFIDAGDMLITERPGRIRIYRDGALRPEPVANVSITNGGEGGLLGIAAHPDFSSNRLFYVYYTSDQGDNRVERRRLSEDGSSAAAERVIVDGIPVARFHNGGRLRFGPDGMLYVGTGDAGEPRLSQDRNSLAGKLLRYTPDGEIPSDNPFPDSPVYVTGIRNTQGFDWAADGSLWITDHGPSGEMGRRGHDEVSLAAPGANLGWPDIYGCETQEGMVTPALTWRDAVPPGGAAIYHHGEGSGLSEWDGSLFTGTLGSRHLHRIEFDEDVAGRIRNHEVYFRGDPPEGYGRLREVIQGPDGELYVTTSNCDGRGSCPDEGDLVLRITGQ